MTQKETDLMITKLLTAHQQSALIKQSMPDLGSLKEVAGTSDSRNPASHSHREACVHEASCLVVGRMNMAEHIACMYED